MTAGMTPPSRWNYATYEDYAAAYQAYIAEFPERRLTAPKRRRS
ncbi:MAG: hypothetical protein ACLSG5_06860 [Oscillospiraceae bacterium]